MKKLLQINPVLRINTSTGRIMQEIGELAIANGWENYIAYSFGRDGIKPCKSKLVPIGNKLSVAWHGVMTRLFDRHGLSSKGATRRFIEMVEDIKPDIIHIHNIHGYFLNYKLLFDYLSKSNVQVIWTVHDCWLYTGHCYHYAYAGCYKWQTECAKCQQKREFPSSYLVDRSSGNFRDKRAAFTSMSKDRLQIVTVSEWMRKEMANSFLKDYSFKVIHNGINLENFHVYDDANVRKKYNVGKRHILLGVASIWSKEKGFDDFLRLSEMLNEDEVIVLVGVGDKEMKMLPHNVVGIRRTENIHELAELYSAADAFVNLTYQDNYPTVNLEAIACGTPVVTYRTGGSVESVTSETGIVVEQGDVNGVMNAVREIITKGKQHYKDVCCDYAHKHFSKEDCYAEYIRMYEELLKK